MGKYKNVEEMPEDERKKYIFDLVFAIQKQGRPDNSVLAPFLTDQANFWMKKLSRYGTISRTLRSVIPPSRGYRTWNYQTNSYDYKRPALKESYIDELQHIFRPEYLSEFNEAYLAYDLQESMAQL